jgi:hypothetical protein
LFPRTFAKLALALAVSLAAYGQTGVSSSIAGKIRTVSSDPTGNACSPGDVRSYNGAIYSCQSSVYALISGGPGGTPSLTPVTIATGASTGTITHNLDLDPPYTLSGLVCLTTRQVAVTQIVDATNTATVTTGSAHEWVTGARVAIAGVTGGGTGLNGTVQITVTGASTFTYTSSGVTDATYNNVGITATSTVQIHPDSYTGSTANALMINLAENAAADVVCAASVGTAGSTGATGATGQGFSDGDKGDVVISSSGAALNFDTSVVTAWAKTILDDANQAATRTTLGLVPGTDVQAYDAELAAIAGLTSGGDKVPYFTGSGTAAVADFTSFARTLVATANAAAARTALAAYGSGDNAAFNTVAVTPGSDAIAGAFRRNGAAQTANIVEFQTEANAMLSNIDKTGKFNGPVASANVTVTATAAGAPLVARTDAINTVAANPFMGVQNSSNTWLGGFLGSGKLNIPALTSGAAMFDADGTLQKVTGTATDCVLVNGTSGACGSGSGDLLAANNLSDVANAGTARTNLGLAIGTNVQAYDAQLGELSATPTDDNVAVGSGSAWQYKALPSCSDATGSKLLYNSTTNAFSCGTDQNSGGATPGGSDTQVQFNDGSSFGGDAGLTYNKTTDVLSVTGGVSTGTGSGAAGYIALLQGTAGTAATNEILIQAPASVTAYQITLPGAAASGVVMASNSGGTVTTSFDNTPDLGTPSAATLTNATGLPISTGVSGLGTGVATALATPSSANLRAALTDESGTGAAYFQGGDAGTPSAIVLTNATGFPTLNQNSTGTAGGLSGTALSGDVTNSGNTITLATKHKTRQFGFVIGADNGSALVDGDDQPSIFSNQLGFGITITRVWCETDSGTSTINLQRDDGSAANILSSNLTCDNDGATGTIDTNEDNVADTNNVDFVMVAAAASGTPKRVTVYVRYTVD